MMQPANTIDELRLSCLNGKFELDGTYIPPTLRPTSVDLSNIRLTSLIGCPQEINGNFWCSYNNLTSMEGAPKHINVDLYANDNQLTNLHNIHHHITAIKHRAKFARNPIVSHVLGLLKIEGLKFVLLDNKDVQNIINKHLMLSKDILDCQEELIDAGYPEFALL